MFNSTVLSNHYTDPNYEVNSKLDLLFRSITNQTGTLESCNMISEKKKKENADTCKEGSCHNNIFETEESCLQLVSGGSV